MSVTTALAAAPPKAEPTPEEAAHPRSVERSAGTAQALNERVLLGYDAEGRLHQRETRDALDGDRLVAREDHTCDDAGRLVRVQRWSHDDATSAPSTEAEVRRHDAHGHLVEQRFFGSHGKLTGRVTWTWREGQPVEARLLDAHGKELERDTYVWGAPGGGAPGLVVSWTHKSAAVRWTVTYERGPRGRLARKIHSRDGVTTYRYDEAGRLVERTARGPVQGGAAPGAPTKSGPVTERVRYRWDEQGRLSERIVERNGWPKPTRERFVYRYIPSAAPGPSPSPSPSGP